MEIVLHLGVHRTGTTSTQAALAAQSGALAALGIRVLTPREFRPLARGGAIARLRRSAPARALAARLAAREAERQGVRLLVISDENLLGSAAWLFPGARPGFLAGRPVPKRRALYPEAGRRLGLLARALRPWPVRAVVTLRGYAEWSESLFAHVCRHRSVAGFDAAKPRVLSATGRWPQLVAELAAAFPARDVACYEDLAARRGAALERLVGAEGARICMERATGWRNRSVPSGAVEALVARWSASGPPPDRAECEAIVKALARPDAARFAPWTPEERAHLAALYAQDLDAIAALGPGAGLRRGVV